MRETEEVIDRENMDDFAHTFVNGKSIGKRCRHSPLAQTKIEVANALFMRGHGNFH
jgi:hypothetical protein